MTLTTAQITFPVAQKCCYAKINRFKNNTLQVIIKEIDRLIERTSEIPPFLHCITFRNMQALLSLATLSKHYQIIPQQILICNTYKLTSVSIVCISSQ